MKKRIKLFLAAAIAAIVSVAAGFYSYNATQEKMLAQEQELLLENDVDALTDVEWSHMFSCFSEYWNSDMSFSDYWSSKVWECVQVPCTKTTGVNEIIVYTNTYDSYVYQCVSGSHFAHCATDCPAAFFS